MIRSTIYLSSRSDFRASMMKPLNAFAMADKDRLVADMETLYLGNASDVTDKLYIRAQTVRARGDVSVVAAMLDQVRHTAMSLDFFLF